MASRSIQPAPASDGASQHTKTSHLRRRPSFGRTSSDASTTSIHSSRSEDSLIATLRSLSSADNNSRRSRESMRSLASLGGASPRCHTPVNVPSLSLQATDNTPGRKRSKPIAIELPPRKSPVYTPLTARGDLKGGYFPYHDPLSSSYKSTSLRSDQQENYDIEESTWPPSSPLNMSNTASVMASPVETAGRTPPPVLGPTFGNTLLVPEGLTMPAGKYHPSNYKAPPKAAPRSAPALQPQNMSLPSSIPDRKKRRPDHVRHASDVKRKLQEYQMGQARNAAILAHVHGGPDSVGMTPEPISPRLEPLGSPGPMTPFALEESSQAGYVVAGASRATTNEALFRRGQERERDRELVGRMIRAEEERRALRGKEGSHSPVLRV